MNIEQIQHITNTFLSEEFEVDVDSMTPEAEMKATLDLDSLDYVDLVVLIEENFNFKITAEDFKTINTFQDFYQFVATKVAHS